MKTTTFRLVIFSGQLCTNGNRFEHERELRAVSCDVPSATTGNYAPPECGEWRSVDLDALIDVVYIAPNAPRWFAELVENVSKKYDLQKPVKHSSLDAEPLR
jgi:hypothetical protein